MTRLGSWRRYLHQRGLMATGHALIKRYIYDSRRWIIDRAVLAGPPPDDHVGDIFFRLATPSDLEHLEELEAYGRGSRQKTFVEQDKDWLFVACHGHRIVATARYGRMVRDELIARVVQLGQGDVWGADQFCLPDYRNRGISRLLAVFANRYLASLGYTSVMNSVLTTNTPSLRMSLHKGNKPLYYVSYSRILLLERLRVSRDIPKQFRDGLIDGATKDLGAGKAGDAPSP